MSHLSLPSRPFYLALVLALLPGCIVVVRTDDDDDVVGDDDDSFGDDDDDDTLPDNFTPSVDFWEISAYWRDDIQDFEWSVDVEASDRDGDSMRLEVEATNPTSGATEVLWAFDSSAVGLWFDTFPSSDLDVFADHQFHLRVYDGEGGVGSDTGFYEAIPGNREPTFTETFVELLWTPADGWRWHIQAAARDDDGDPMVLWVDVWDEAEETLLVSWEFPESESSWETFEPADTFPLTEDLRFFFHVEDGWDGVDDAIVDWISPVEIPEILEVRWACELRPGNDLVFFVETDVRSIYGLDEVTADFLDPDTGAFIGGFGLEWDAGVEFADPDTSLWFFEDLAATVPEVDCAETFDVEVAARDARGLLTVSRFGF